jgi:hypothetical protein
MAGRQLLKEGFMRSLGLIVAGALFATPVLARPITYPGGSMAMTENADEYWTNEVMYTPSARYSVGVRSEYAGEDNRQYQGLSANFLAYRHNAQDGQANVYLLTSAGIASNDKASLRHKTGGAGLLGLEADWENRRFLILGQVKGFAAQGIDKTLTWRGRVGVAPYVGEFGDLHTWLMLQVDHEPESRDPVNASGVVRFFKGPVLIELGSSLKGDAFASAMFYF